MAQQLDIQYVRFYTDGSAARKVAPAIPLKTLKLPKLKKHKKVVLHIDPIAICSILMAGLMLILMTVGVVKLCHTRQQLTAMNAYIETLREENTELNATMSQGYDLAEIERTALALGMVPEEQVQHIQLQMPATVEEETPGAWEQFYIFLTGLFA